MGSILSSKGASVIEVGDFARSHGLCRSIDKKRQSYDVDTDELDEVIKKELGRGSSILIGHLSHHLGADLIIVLRCRPSVLRGRLEGRGWRKEKVRENMEAEACDVILIESLEKEVEVLEIDTTIISPDDVAAAVLEIMNGEKEKYAVGNVDWSDEVLGWF